VYRFLLTPRWLGYAALMAALAAIMVLLGLWQLDRFHQRSAINARIDGSAAGEPVSIERVLPPPTGTSSAAPAPHAAAWTRVEATGRYDPAYEVLVRNRTVDGAVGFEIVTPLIRDDGTAVLVDRGWVAPAAGGAVALPTVPPAPAGTVTVVGRVHLPESRAGRVEHLDGRLTVQRVAPAVLARAMPYPLYGAYVTLDRQVPPADAHLVPIAPEHENALQNGGYVIQWWLFAAMAVGGFGFLVRREAHPVESGDAGFDRVPMAPATT
jgi:cytochrome oxidase assembly protein ShyY1